MTTNSQLSTTEPKTKSKTNKETTRPGTESQKWRLQGGLSAGRGREEREGEGTENKQHKLQVDNRRGEVKNRIVNVEAKELTCTTRGHELKAGGMWAGGSVQGRGERRGENGTTVIA